MSAVLLLSNGHGEDLSGASLGRQLRARGMAVEALPLVGHGQAYREAGIPLLAATRSFSTGGLGYTSLAGRLTDLREGQTTYVLRLLALLWRRRRRFRLIVAVGDLVPVLGAWLTGRPTAVYLVAYSSHYEGRLRLPWPCGPLLRRSRVQAVWSRDRLTAEDLSRQLGRPVHFLGNPFLDPLLTGLDAAAGGQAAAPDGGTAEGPAGKGPAGKDPAGKRSAGHAGPPVVAVLPGSRLPEALGNLVLLLGVLERLPAAAAEPDGEPILQAALVGALEPAAIAAAAAGTGWRLEEQRRVGGDRELSLVRGARRLALHWDRFSRVLADSDLVLAMSGTASEQAVALARPVLQVAGPGPQFTEGFAEAQRRLLGPGVCCAAGAVGQPATLAASARLLRSLLDRLADPVAGSAWRRELEAIARERLGPPGGSERMAAAIMEILGGGPTAPAH